MWLLVDTDRRSHKLGRYIEFLNLMFTVVPLRTCHLLKSLESDFYYLQKSKYLYYEQVLDLASADYIFGQLRPLMV